MYAALATVIAAKDLELHAWVEIAPQPPLADGPLRGLTFGVKDVFETLGMATEYGSPLCAGRKGNCDAAVVTELRRLGAVLVGKTQTAAFASFDPAPTRNPRDAARTPGGSSSGSAAAVAAGHVDFALGTQTLGSVIRPASYCEVCGFKPGFGALSMEGVLAFAPSLDTVGLFTRTPREMRDLWRSWRGGQGSVERRIVEGFPPWWDEVSAAARLVNDYEGARSHEARYAEYGERIGVKLAALVRKGLAVQDGEYRDALAAIAAARAEYRVGVLTPAATGPAPLGLESTGDPAMNAPWTAIGAAAICIPRHPVGLQLTLPAGRESDLLETAVALQNRD